MLGVNDSGSSDFGFIAREFRSAYRRLGSGAGSANLMTVYRLYFYGLIDSGMKLALLKENDRLRDEYEHGALGPRADIRGKDEVKQS